MADDWKERAEKAGTSISKFVVERVEDSIRREEGEESYTSRLELIERLRKTGDELKRLREDNRLLRRLVDNLDKEFKRYRSKPFLEEEFQGISIFDRDLVRILKEGGMLSDDSILAQLDIDPSDFELVKAVSNQLRDLESYGLVEFLGRDWKWKE